MRLVSASHPRCEPRSPRVRPYLRRSVFALSPGWVVTMCTAREEATATTGSRQATVVAVGAVAKTHCYYLCIGTIVVGGLH